MINYHGRKFKPVSNMPNGETGQETIFHYIQEGNIVKAAYKGGKIKSGHLIALVETDGTLHMRYHQVNLAGELMTGICTSKPELLINGKIRLHEEWQWTSGDQSKGRSILEET